MASGDLCGQPHSPPPHPCTPVCLPTTPKVGAPQAGAWGGSEIKLTPQAQGGLPRLWASPKEMPFPLHVHRLLLPDRSGLSSISPPSTFPAFQADSAPKARGCVTHALPCLALRQTCFSPRTPLLSVPHLLVSAQGQSWAKRELRLGGLERRKRVKEVSGSGCFEESPPPSSNICHPCAQQLANDP